MNIFDKAKCVNTNVLGLSRFIPTIKDSFQACKSRFQFYHIYALIFEEQA